MARVADPRQRGLFVEVTPYQKLDAKITLGGLVAVNTYPSFGFKANKATQNSSKELHAFQPVLILNKSNLNAFDGFGEAFIAPAIFAYYVEKETAIQTGTDVAIASIDIVSLAIPATYATKIGRLFYYADKISSITSLAAGFTNENSTTRAVLSGISLITGIASAGEMFSSIKPKTIYKSRVDVQSDFKKFVTEIEKLTDSQIKELNHKEKIAKFIENYGKELNLYDQQTTELVAMLRGGVNGAGNTPALLAKWDNLTISEAKSLYNQIAKTEIQGSKIVRTQSEILQEVQQRGITNPYNFSHPIEDFTLTNDAFFVRAYNQNKTGRWLISIDDVDGFASVDDFIKKTALPVVDEFGTVLNPDKMALVKVTSGTTIRKSVARPQDWGGQGHLPGGATQYEIIEFNWQSMGEWYKEMGIISDFIK